MATYKVIQDIEAEDKLVGPLTLRQFIYAAVAAVAGYICVLAVTKGAAFLVVFFVPIMAGAGFFAFPWKGEQPTEIWALARLRFTIKPRVRIWDQDGAKDLVTVLAPKKIEVRRSSKADLTQTEVRSRLKALADTIDSRGWATRNAAYGIYGQQWAHPTVAPVPGIMPLADIPSYDMFDTGNSVAQNFDSMLSKSSVQQRQRAVQQMVQPQQVQQQPQQQIVQLPSPVMPGYGGGAGAMGRPAPQPQQPMMTAMAPPPTANYRQPLQQPAPPVAQMPNQQPNNYWFANGPAYPTMPQPMNATPQMAPPIASPVMSTPPPTPTPMPAPAPMPLPAPNPAPTESYIESDAPVPVAATPTAEESRLGEDIRRQNQAAMAINYSHMRVLQPAGSSVPTEVAAPPIDYTTALGGVPQNDGAWMGASMPPTENMPDATVAGASGPAAAQPVTRTPDPAILELANNDDLDIATIARQANKQIKQAPDEVEIRLH